MATVSEADLRRAFAAHVSTSFDDATLRHLLACLTSTGGLKAVEMSELTESWAPFLTDAGACANESEAQALCEKVLADLRAPNRQAAPAGAERGGGASQPERDIREELIPWLDKLKIKQYQAKAEEWCKEMGAIHLEEIFENIDDFIDKLGLKPLEKKRVEKSAAEGAGGKPAGNAAAQPAALAEARPAHNGNAQGAPPSSSSRQVIALIDSKYKVEEILGEGATAKVYRCTKGDEVYAMKTISLQKLRLQRDFQRISDRLQREIQILFSLRHPKIVSLYDVVEERDNLHLIMELVPGRDLFDKIVEKRSFQEPVAKYVFIQICEGLQYIHSKGIVYRDLKPENILVQEERQEQGLTLLEIKLTDFGHSKLINDGYSIPLTRVGTPQYWAPEVSDAQMAARGYGKEVDLWSLGVVVFVMLIGSYPFNGVGEPIEIQIRNAKLDFRNRLISQLSQKLIRSLIQVKPGDRLRLEQCLEHPWAEGARPLLNRLMKLSTVTGPSDQKMEECFAVAPAVDRQKLQKDLNQWMAKFKCPASIRNEEVYAIIPEASYEAARPELERLVQFHNEQAQAGPGPAAAPVPVPVPVPVPTDAGGNGAGRRYFRMVATVLRVSPTDGAGLVLKPERGGMRISDVLPNPGQPDLQVHDLITTIQEVSLRGTPETVQEIFGNYFCDGAHISVKRETR